jgi:hypothetical protein
MKGWRSCRWWRIWGEGRAMGNTRMTVLRIRCVYGYEPRIDWYCIGWKRGTNTVTTSTMGIRVVKPLHHHDKKGWHLNVITSQCQGVRYDVF